MPRLSGTLADGFNRRDLLKAMFIPEGFREIVRGWQDYGRCPDHSDSDKPFNGQPVRQMLVQDLITTFRPLAIIETGTFRGATTEYLAKTGLPVFTFEFNHRNFGFARHRLLWRRNVRMRLCDSRAGLRLLLDGRLRGWREERLLFYLDAHWNEDLPLGGEVEIIFGRCRSAIVMIDDFEVPGDPGYVFDDYGRGNTLNTAYIAPCIRAYGLSVFYPSTRSSDEGGWEARLRSLSKKFRSK